MPAAVPSFDNSEQRPTPLAGAASLPRAVDTRPLDYGIPSQEQDLDLGRDRIDPQDGQAVVDLLNQPSEDVGGDIGTSSPSTLIASRESGSLSEMLYAEHGTLSS